MRGQAIKFRDFHAGLNTNDGVYVIGDGEARDCLNVVSTARGTLKKRDGNVVFASAPSTSSAFTSLFGFETFVSGNATKWLIGAHGANLYSVANPVSGASSVVSIKGSLTGSMKWDWASYPSSAVPGASGYAFGMDGVNTPQYWTGATSSTPSVNWVPSASGTTNTTAASGANKLLFTALPVGFAVNAVVTYGGSSIPAGTYITEVTSTSITLSNNLTGSINSGTSITATNSGSVPNGKYLVSWQGRLWAAGVDNYGSRLYYSDLGNAFSWPTTNTADFDTADGEAITGIGTFGPYLLIFKRSKIFAIYDVDPSLGPLNRVISRNVGACSHRSIVETPKGTLFLTPDKGVWSTNGSTVEDLSMKVRPSFALYTPSESNAAAAFYNNHYYVSFQNAANAGSVNDSLMDFDFATVSWWKHSCPASQFAVWRSGSSTSSLLFGIRPTATVGATGTPLTTSGVDKFFVSGQLNDNGYAFPVLWVSAWHTFGEPQLRKRLRRIVFDGAGSFNCYLGTDFSVGWQLYGALALSQVSGRLFGLDTDSYLFGDVTDPVVFGGTATSVFQSLYGIGGDIVSTGKTGVARTMSVKFEGNANSDLQVNSYTMLIKERKN
jgi:hypothetical protein